MPDSTPKIAIVCYSKTGHSWNVAEKLGLTLDADVYALRTKRYVFPFFGYMRAGFDSLRSAPAPLEHPLPDIRDHDAVIICGPVWTGYPAVPLLSYLQQETQLPEAVGLMLTCGETARPEKAFAIVAAELRRPLVAQDAISNSIEDQPEADQKIAAFANAMRDAVAAS